MATTFWPTLEHWSVKIPLHSGHYRMPMLDESGFVALKPIGFNVPAVEWESLEYMDWKSGGDTNFAPIASADGELDCRGFWDKGKPDKGAMYREPVPISGVYESSSSSPKIAIPPSARFIVMTTTA
jgi:hypothetical protein